MPRDIHKLPWAEQAVEFALAIEVAVAIKAALAIRAAVVFKTNGVVLVGAALAFKAGEVLGYPQPVRSNPLTA
jgi:hypothetical protein